MSGKDKVAKKSGFDTTAVVMALACVAGSYLLTTTFKSTAQSPNKTFGSFEEFYPFYISQHADETCRRLHFVGTSLIFLFNVYEWSVFPSLIMAGIVGSGVFAATQHIDHGFFELGAMMLTFIIFMRKFTGSWAKGLAVPIVAYGFAWVGHFYFEMNKPATFVYPMYSLFGDFRLFFEIASTQRKF